MAESSTPEKQQPNDAPPGTEMQKTVASSEKQVDRHSASSPATSQSSSGSNGEGGDEKEAAGYSGGPGTDGLIESSENVYFWGVPSNFTEFEMNLLVFAAGDVVSVKMGHANGKPNTYAFVQFKKQEEAEAAIKMLHNRKFHSRNLVVQYAKPAKLATSSNIKKNSASSVSKGAVNTAISDRKRIRPRGVSSTSPAAIYESNNNVVYTPDNSTIGHGDGGATAGGGGGGGGGGSSYMPVVAAAAAAAAGNHHPYHHVTMGGVTTTTTTTAGAPTAYHHHPYHHHQQHSPLQMLPPPPPAAGGGGGGGGSSPPPPHHRSQPHHHHHHHHQVPPTVPPTATTTTGTTAPPHYVLPIYQTNPAALTHHPSYHPSTQQHQQQLQQQLSYGRIGRGSGGGINITNVVPKLPTNNGIAHSSSSNNIYISGLPENVTDKSLEQLFLKYGTVVSTRVIINRNTGTPLGTALVRMESCHQAAVAIGDLNGCQLNGGGRGHILSCRFAHEKRTPPSSTTNLYISGLPEDVTEGSLKELFAAFGNVVSQKIIINRNTGAPLGTALVRMETNDQANTCISNLHGSKMNGGKFLTVRFAADKGNKHT